jgi:2-polyprenyl-6-methoxyphenol hydroxylase-like FAD-dependent oxidoreductase
MLYSIIVLSFVLLFLCRFLDGLKIVRVGIIGAGPAGLALVEKILAKKDDATRFEIDVFESRNDPRRTTNHTSYAIGCNARMWQALNKTESEGLLPFLEHRSCSLITSTKFISGWKIAPSISPRVKRFMTTQPLFASGLLDWIETMPKKNSVVNIRFNTKVLGLDARKGLVYSLKNGINDNDSSDNDSSSSSGSSAPPSTDSYDLIIGADGARSTARQAILAETGAVNFEGR